jgi:transposase InsO family protein
VSVKILPEKSAACAQGFLTHLLQAAPFRITQILTDNGQEFTDRFCATGERELTGKHGFERICHEQHIEHRLIPPRHPQTNGMIERFNGRISEVLATHHFRSGEHLAATLQRYVNVYNHHLPQRALGMCARWRLWNSGGQNSLSCSFQRLIISRGLTPM